MATSRRIFLVAVSGVGPYSGSMVKEVSNSSTEALVAEAFFNAVRDRSRDCSVDGSENYDYQVGFFQSCIKALCRDVPGVKDELLARVVSLQRIPQS